MNRKLLMVALLTAPILAMYGVFPIYLFNKIPFGAMVLSVIFLSIMLFLFWVINIYLHHTIPNSIKRYAFSFIITVSLHSVIIFSSPDFPIGSKFLLYPTITTVFINTFMLIILHLVISIDKQEKATDEIKSLKMSNLEAQKQVLVQQLQPHFLFNALSVLKSLIKENPTEGEYYVLKLSDFLRYSVEAHTQETATLFDELKFTQDYIDLQKVRFGNALRETIELKEAVLQKRLPVYALQTLVENAIKHNAFTKNKPLHIQIGYADDRLWVSNNRFPKQLVHSSGIGLRNLQERYRIMAGKEIVVKDTAEEFTVYLPLL